MKTFKNIKVGVLETVSDELAKQYEKYTDVYELVDKTKKNNKENN